jgi:hypothetical protein
MAGMESSPTAEHVARLDRILYNFSDAATGTHPLPERTELWNRAAADRSISNVSKLYAPVGLEQQFKELYTMLHPCLVQRDGKNNASAFLQGTRGSGKTLLLNQCLQAFQDELSLQTNTKAPFRIVRLNGIMIPGDNVAIVVKEILRQLSTAAFQQTADRNSAAAAVAVAKEEEEGDSPNRPQKRSKTKSTERMEKLLRLRQSNFTNNLQLLNEILQLACVDCIPVLFVLDELDAFVGTSGGSFALQEDTRSTVMTENVGKDRQLLLYHLLDRVATQGSFICFVGSTSHQGIMGMLEKRIRSRAEGTSRFIHFGPCPTFASLVSLLTSKCLDNNDADANGASFHQQVSQLLSSPPIDNAETTHSRVYKALQRDYRLGKGIRWFSRVFSLAISLYRQDCTMRLHTIRSQSLAPGETLSEPWPVFQAQYLADALMDMNSSLSTDIGDRDLVLVDGVASDPRIQALVDLSGPQVALLLSARRVLARDGIREDTTTPLTLDRMLEEYRSYKGSSNRYGGHVLSKSFRDLLELSVFQPAADHSGGGPLQYIHDPSNFSLADVNTAGRIPLHLTVDVRRELRKALEKNLLDCSTALREWGRKTN